MPSYSYFPSASVTQMLSFFIFSAALSQVQRVQLLVHDPYSLFFVSYGVCLLVGAFANISPLLFPFFTPNSCVFVCSRLLCFFVYIYSVLPLLILVRPPYFGSSLYFFASICPVLPLLMLFYQLFLGSF